MYGQCGILTFTNREVILAETFICNSSEFKDDERRIVKTENDEVGIFKENGNFHAYSNYCVHQGGPACEGMIIAGVEERFTPDRQSRGMYFSDTELHFVCPWHGYEYDMRTGECIADRRLRLRRYEVIEKDGALYVRREEKK
jgi:nitrite reductase/ring-hydroxylating ferredoxin subunit